MYHAVVKQPQSLLDQMDDWNTKQHKSTGLVDKIPNGKSETQVEDELIDFCSKHFDEPVIIAGNSIGQDRLFLTKYFPRFSELMHYRQLDVTAFKLAFAPKGVEFKKQNTHRALDDIKESMAEFQFFMDKFSS
jgi:oligoribonuclease